MDDVQFECRNGKELKVMLGTKVMSAVMKMLLAPKLTGNRELINRSRIENGARNRPKIWQTLPKWKN